MQHVNEPAKMVETLTKYGFYHLESFSFSILFSLNGQKTYIEGFFVPTLFVM